MRRRGFLKGLFGAATVAAVGKGDGVELTSIAHPYVGNECAEDMVCGFGLAPVRREGSTLEYEHEVLRSKRWVSHQALENEVWEVTDKRVLAVRDDMVLIEYPACDCDDGPHGTACSNRNVLRHGRLG